MNYIKFLSSDVYRLIGSRWKVGAPSVTIAMSKITSVQETNTIGSDGRLLYAVNVENGLNTTRIIYVAADSPAITVLKNSVDFSYLSKNNIYTVTNGYYEKSKYDIILNNNIISRTSETDIVVDNVILSSLTYVESQNSYRIYINSAASSMVVENPTLNNGESTLVLHVDDDTDCVAFLIVNHTTGTVKTHVTDVRYTGNNWDYDVYDQRFNCNVQNGGFMPVLWDADTNANKTYFINVDGEIVDSVFTGGAYNWDTLNYGATWFMDIEDTYSILFYFDGTTVKRTVFEGLGEFAIPTYRTTKDGSTIMFILQGEGMDTTENSYILKANGELINISNTLSEVFSDSYNSDFFANSFADYFVLYTWSLYPEQEDYLLNKIVILSQDGVVLNTFNASGYQVTDWNDEGFAPNGDYNGLYYNQYDNDINWLMINYCPHTNKFIIATHERGNNYNDVDAYMSYVNYGRNYNSNRNSISYVFYNQDDSSYNFRLADYVDVVWLNHGNTDFQKYTLADDTWFYFQEYNSDNNAMYSDSPLLVGCLDDSEELVKMYTFTATGVNIYETEFILDDATNINTFEMINGSAVRFDVDYTEVRNWIFFDNAGDFVTSMTTGPDWLTEQKGHAFVVIDREDFNNNFIYHTDLGIIDFPNTWDDYDNPGFDLIVDANYGTFTPVRKTRLLIVLKDSGNPRIFYRLDETGLREGIGNTKADDGYNDINLSDDSFNYFFYNDNDNTRWLYKYDWATGRCLSIENLLSNSYDDYWSYGERFLVTEFVDSGVRFHFATRDGKKVITIADNSSYEVAMNDYWWFD